MFLFHSPLHSVPLSQGTQSAQSTAVSMGIFTAKSQSGISPPPTPSTPPILTEIVFLLGHLSRVGSCRCCWRLWSWEEVPATPKSKCFFFHFPVLVSFFLRCERRGGIPLGMIGTRFVWLSFPWSTGKPVLCVWIFVSSKRRILFYGGFQCTLITVRSKQNL